MKCPNDNGDLAPATRDGVAMQACPKCSGMWLTRPELNTLEDKAFDLGDDEKGTLVFDAEPSNRPCPECGKPMKTFNYRAYELELDFCDEGHGYWLEAGEDRQLLNWMKEEEARVKRSGKAQKNWTSLVGDLHSNGLRERLRELFR
ncbi:MAG TPA: zf-TFIIB domain-containing protein [Caulobacteraceae bacterium]|nr:zf-TFIIB domain-containing protein [Caulobacteraceae bacterium]